MKTKSNEKKLRAALENLTDAVGWGVLNALSPREIKDSYSGVAKAYNRAVRVIDQTRPSQPATLKEMGLMT